MSSRTLARLQRLNIPLPQIRKSLLLAHWACDYTDSVQINTNFMSLGHQLRQLRALCSLAAFREPHRARRNKKGSTTFKRMPSLSCSASLACDQQKCGISQSSAAIHLFNGSISDLSLLPQTQSTGLILAQYCARTTQPSSVLRI